MASDYGLNFGFRRSDESMAIREGRHKTPATGDPLLLGTAVQIDPDNPGFLAQCAADAPYVPGFSGLLVQEDSHLGSVFEPAPYLGHDSIDLGAAKRDTLAIIWGGSGTKVWFKNTPEYSRGDRSKAAVEMFEDAGLAVGDQIGWDGTKWSASAVEPWMTVTAVSTEYCEAVIR